VSTNTVIGFENPGVAAPVVDALTEVLRTGARQLLAQAVEAEVTDFLAQH
jgi:putative transposase